MRKILTVKFHTGIPMKPFLEFDIDHFPPYAEGQTTILEATVDGTKITAAYVITEVVHTITHVKKDVGAGAIQDWQRFTMLINVKHQSTLGK